MAEFDSAVDLVLKHEGNEANIPGDKGLITKFGISLIFYRLNIKHDAIDKDIKNLTLEDAKDIYYKYFWSKYPFARIINQKVANRLFDLSVNCGPKQAFLCMQRAINDVGTEISIDGSLGLETLKAINNPDIQVSLYNALIQEATKFYEKIAQNGQNSKFKAGWINRLTDTP